MVTVATPDFRTYSWEPAVTAAAIERNVVKVRWADGAEGCFHHIWLRDNCADERSIDPHSRERIYDFLSIPLDIRPKQIGVSKEGALAVTWAEDGFVSLYHPGWLRAHCYSLGAQRKFRPEIETWDGKLANQMPFFDWRKVTEDQTERLNWLRAIRRLGLTLLTGGPSDPDAFTAWAEKMFVIRDMNWGKYYDVVYEEEGVYIANKGLAIPPHVDGPTREYMPGIQLFQCVLNNVEGGVSYWADAFHVAETLRREFPEDFRLLSSVAWPTANRHKTSEYMTDVPLIRVDAEGRLLEVRDTHWLREPLLAAMADVERIYAAYRRYAEMTRDPANHIVHRLVPGEIAVIDNRRVLHARGPYTDAKGRRHMRVCFTEREEVESAIAVLQRETRASAIP
jgi:gamma-butyrobetaine dioxygenase